MTSPLADAKASARTAREKPALKELASLTQAAQAAGEIALRAFRLGARTTAKVHWKEGNSPVTDADMAVDAALRAQLAPLFPEAGWLSEETVDDPARLTRRRALIVDPIDGTRGFMEGDARFCVCAALVEDGAPIAGVVHLPALGETFTAAQGAGAFLNGAPIRVSAKTDLAGARAAGPKPMIEALQRSGAPILPEPRAPSLAFRLVMVACGRLDAALVSARAHDWDLAAADAILHEAGGSLTDLEGIRPAYNRAETRHHELAAAPIALREALLTAARAARR
jgi:myo-inositol-1(or 4)-monophosphatase